MEYSKNNIVTLTIEDIGTEGEGIGKIDGFTLFIKDAVVGDTVEARILKAKKNFAYARVEKILEPSPYRVEPKCTFHRQCGGCQIQALSYKKQLEFKQNKVKNNLTRIGGFEESFIDSVMEPIVGMEEPWHYRNKAQYPVGTNKEGKIITGFYAGRTHSIISNTQCYLGDPGNQKILEIILEFLEKYGIEAYNEETGRGLVRHVLIRTGFTSGELMVCLVINGCSASGIEEISGKREMKKGQKCVAGRKADIRQEICRKYIPHEDELIEALTKIKGMTSISVSINTEKTNVIMGKEIHLLWGRPTIQDVIHVRDMEQEGYPFTGQQLTFKISPLSFYQVNPEQTEKLYSLALQYAGLTGKETVWDLYCGIGTISLFLAAKAKRVYGVEIVPQAIEDAKENAVRNGITNADFFVGKAEEVLPEYYERMSRGVPAAKDGCTTDGCIVDDCIADGCARGETVDMEACAAADDVKRSKGKHGSKDMLHPDVIVVDPPRKGCDQACLDTMLKMQPERIVYVSCDSATMARDLRILCDGGYELRRVRPVDQFGHTIHVESTVLLQRRGADPAH